jgi:hypothetical protein
MAQGKSLVALQLFGRHYSSDQFSSDPTYEHEVLVDGREFHHEDTNVSYSTPFPHRTDLDHSAIHEGAPAYKASPTAPKQKDTQFVPLRPSFGAERPHYENADNVVSAGGAALKEENADTVSSFIPRTFSCATGAGGVAKAPKTWVDRPKAGSSNTFEAKKAERHKRLERKEACAQGDSCAS